MTEIKMIIKSKDDKTPAIPSKNYSHLTLKSFVILEAATSNNKTGVVLHTKLTDGRDIFINTTAAIFKGMSEVLAGAEARFKEGLPTIPDMPVIDTINQLIQMNKEQIDVMEISDGKTTFGELYDLLKEVHSFNLDYVLHEKIEKILNK